LRGAINGQSKDIKTEWECIKGERYVETLIFGLHVVSRFREHAVVVQGWRWKARLMYRA
jgi:hypothetical protein